MSLSYLPLDVIKQILEYDGRIKYRNGKFINQILPNDYRYDLLKKLVKPFTYNYDPYNLHSLEHRLYGFVATSNFRIEKWRNPHPSTTVTIVDIKYEMCEYKYIQDNIFYNCLFFKLRPKPVILRPTLSSVVWRFFSETTRRPSVKPSNSFFGRLYYLFGEFLSHFKSSRV